jgi:hypothetical protein
VKTSVPNFMASASRMKPDNKDIKRMALLLFSSRLPSEARIERPRNQSIEDADAPMPKANLSDTLVTLVVR